MCHAKEYIIRIFRVRPEWKKKKRINMFTRVRNPMENIQDVEHLKYVSSNH